MRPLGKLVTVAIHPWQDLGQRAWDAVDRVHVMAYDGNDGAGRHATLANAKQFVRQIGSFGDARTVSTATKGGARNFPATNPALVRKLALGVPFYGRNRLNLGDASTYRDVGQRAPHLSPSTDEVGDVYFNGVDTLQRKVAFAREARLAGLMIWELGQDDDHKTLLNAVLQAADAPDVQDIYDAIQQRTSLSPK